jgi:hypothetical protein
MYLNAYVTVPLHARALAMQTHAQRSGLRGAQGTVRLAAQPMTCTPNAFQGADMACSDRDLLIIALGEQPSFS